MGGEGTFLSVLVLAVVEIHLVAVGSGRDVAEHNRRPVLEPADGHGAGQNFAHVHSLDFGHRLDALVELLRVLLELAIHEIAAEPFGTGGVRREDELQRRMLIVLDVLRRVGVPDEQRLADAVAVAEMFDRLVVRRPSRS